MAPQRTQLPAAVHASAAAHLHETESAVRLIGNRSCNMDSTLIMRTASKGGSITVGHSSSSWLLKKAFAAASSLSCADTAQSIWQQSGQRSVWGEKRPKADESAGSEDAERISRGCADTGVINAVALACIWSALNAGVLVLQVYNVS